MRVFLERHRHSSLLVAVLLGQLFFLAYQIKTQDDVRLIRRWVVAVASPVERVVRGASDSVGSLVEDYVALRHAHRENQRLRTELEQAQLRLHELEAQASQSEELAALLELKQAYAQAPLVAAKVIAVSPASATRGILIDRGATAGVAVNSVVLTPTGVVGKVVTVFPRTAQVLLITDRKSGVGVRVAGSELVGVVKGTGATECVLEYIPNDAEIPAGAKLYTSGQDQLFPAGLPVGRVRSSRPGELFQEVQVEPAASLNRLDYVLVLAGAPETLGTAAQATRTSDRLAP